MVVTFNNELEVAQRVILSWQERALLKSVTVIRDVFGKLSFLLESTSYPEEEGRNTLEQLVQGNLQGYYGGKLYWENMPAKQRRYLQPMFDLLKEERKEWEIKEGIQFYLSERPISKKAWISYPYDQDAAWSYEDALQGRKPKIVSFYSFKGGMGRTTAVASIALQLVRKGRHVMLVDMDIEAPGLATLFFEETAIDRGVLDYLLESPLSTGETIMNYVMDVTELSLLRENDGSLYVLPAGKVDEYYLQKLARIDFQDHREGALRDALYHMLQQLSETYFIDYILIDSRAGFHDMGGIAVTQLPHGVVLFGNQSRQSWDGLAQVLHTISESHSDNVPVILVDCMCDVSTADTWLQAKESFLQKAYDVCVEQYYLEDEPLPGKDAVNIAHAPVYLPFDSALRQEVTLYSTGSAGEDERVRVFAEHLTVEAYKGLLDRIENWFGEGELL